MTASAPVHGTWEPHPAGRWEDAFLSGNGHHGTLVFGDPDAERVIVTHHTLVRPGGRDPRPPQLAGDLPALQDRLLAGDVNAAESFTDGRPLQWVQPFHPAFQVRLRRPSGDRDDYRRDIDFTTGVVRAACAGWTSSVFVSRADDVIVQQVTGPGLTLDIDLDHRLPGAPAGLGIGHGAVLTPEGALLSLRARYPDGDRACTGVTLVAVTGGTTTLAPPSAHVEGARSVLLLTRVHRHTGELDVVAQGRALRDLPTEYDELLDRHVALHRTAYERVTLDLAADPAERALPGSELLTRPRSAALLERLFAAGRYHLLSACRPLPAPPDRTVDRRLEHGLVGRVHQRRQPQPPDRLRRGRRPPRGHRGPRVPDPAAAPGLARQRPRDLRHPGRRRPRPHRRRVGPLVPLQPRIPAAPVDRRRRLAPQAARRPRRDPGRPRPAHRRRPRRSRPVLRGLPHPHGRARPPRRSSRPTRPRTARRARAGARSTRPWTSPRPVTPCCTAAAYHPGPDADRWRALADRLPPHRINADGALAEWAWPGLEDSYDHRHLSHLYGVWPLDEITPYDTPELAAAAHRALELRGAENDSAHGHLHHALIAARLRDGDRVAHALGQVLDGDFFHASLMSAHYPNRDVYNADAAHTLPAVLIEMLVQSTPDRLVLLPALPAAYPSGALRGVRTRFGAEIDLTWTRDGAAAVIRPSRTHRVELRTSTGTESLHLVAGEDHVLTLRAW